MPDFGIRILIFCPLVIEKKIDLRIFHRQNSIALNLFESPSFLKGRIPFVLDLMQNFTKTIKCKCCTKCCLTKIEFVDCLCVNCALLIYQRLEVNRPIPLLSVYRLSSQMALLSASEPSSAICLQAVFLDGSAIFQEPSSAICLQAVFLDDSAICQ